MLVHLSLFQLSVRALKKIHLSKPSSGPRVHFFDSHAKTLSSKTKHLSTCLPKSSTSKNLACPTPPFPILLPSQQKASFTPPPHRGRSRRALARMRAPVEPRTPLHRGAPSPLVRWVLLASARERQRARLRRSPSGDRPGAQSD